MRRAVAASLALCAGPALSDALPFDGAWAADPAWCQWSDRIGSRTPAPVRITHEVFEGYENSCDVLAVTTGPDAPDLFILDLSCVAESEAYDDQIVFRLTGPDRMMRLDDPAGQFEMTRCEDPT